MALVDLHLHTTASDGRLSPTQLVALLAKQRVQVAAITDHDSTEGLAEAFSAAESFPNLTIIPGIELSADLPGKEIHVLGYFIQYDDVQFQKTLTNFRQDRRKRAQQMVQKLGELGVKIEWERVQELAGDGAVGRPHIAQAMVEKGYIKAFQEAFVTYLGRNGSAYVERERLSPEDSLGLIRRYGGVPVLAHPTYIKNPEEIIERLKEVGLLGMEAYYAKYSNEEIKELVDMAHRYNLLPCGGSDYHAFGTPGEPLPGEMGPPLEVVERLKELALDSSRLQP